MRILPGSMGRSGPAPAAQGSQCQATAPILITDPQLLPHLDQPGGEGPASRCPGGYQWGAAGWQVHSQDRGVWGKCDPL